MIAVREVERMADSEPCYYTPGRVRYWLEHWSDLKELSVPTARAIRYDFIGGGPALDPARMAEIIVDLERAYTRLHPWSLEHQIVEWSMRGHDIVTIARSLRVGLGDADFALDEASAAMAHYLGWRA